MYASFFDLKEPAFDLTPDPRFLLLTDRHREALSNLQYGISGRKGMILLTGEAGTGKTTLLRTALQGTDRETTRVVYLNNPTLTRREFVETIGRRLELSRAAQLSKAACLSELRDRLHDERLAGLWTVLVVDEAQSLSVELLEEIRLLTNIETDDDKLLAVILAGQPELGVRLQKPELRQLKQRIALRCALLPLSQHETAAYIETRIRIAGGRVETMFTPEAIALIHERSRGVPRTINVLCDNALVSGFAVGQRPVGPRLVLDVCHDFDFDSGPAAIPIAPVRSLVRSGRPIQVPPGGAPEAGPNVDDSLEGSHSRLLFASALPSPRRRGHPR